MKQIKRCLIFVVLLSVLILPNFASAAWWNPFSWGIWNQIFHKQTLLVPTQNQNVNSQKQITQPNNQSDCAKFVDQSSQADCYNEAELTKVISTGDPNNCENINIMEKCPYVTTPLRGRVLSCASIKPAYVGKCYSSMWIKFKNPNDCQSIPATPIGNKGAMSSETERDLCYNFWAYKNSDEELCKKISFYWGSQVCLQAINIKIALQKSESDNAKIYEGIPKNLDQNSCSTLAKRIFDASNPAGSGFTTFTYKIYYNNGSCYLLTHGVGERHSQDKFAPVSIDITLRLKVWADCETYTITPNGNFCQYAGQSGEKYDINKFNDYIKPYEVGLIASGDAGNLSASLSDLSAKNTLNQIGTEAWLLFRVTNSYSSLCANGEINASLSPTVNSKPDDMGKYLTSLINDVVKKGGQKPNCFSSANNFCASTQLSDGSWICTNKERWGGNPSMLGTAKCTSPTTDCAH